MNRITIEDAQARLIEILGEMTMGEELVITKDGEPVATLTRSEGQLTCRKAGSAKDKILWMAPDFGAPLEEFRESME